MSRLSSTLQEGGLYVLLFLLPFSISTIEVAFGVLLCCWLYERWSRRTRQDTIWTRQSLRPILWSMGAFLAIGALSILVSDHPQHSLKGLVTKWAEYLFYTVLVAELAARPNVVRRSAVVIAASACFVVIEAVTQELWGHGVFRGYPLTMYSRMTGPYHNPIDLAIYFMAVSGPLLAAGLLERGARRWGSWAVLGLVMACFGRTLALGPWVALAVACVAVMMPAERRFRRAGMVLLGLMAAAAAYFLWRTHLTHAVFTLSDPGTSDRRFMWESALRMIRDRPLLGHGLNTFMANYLDYWVGGERMPRYAHNCYLQTAAETGLIGLAAFVWMLWQVGARIKASLGPPATEERLLLVGLATGWAAFVVHAGVDTDFYSVRQAALFWIMSGLGLGLGARLGDAAPVRREP